MPYSFLGMAWQPENEPPLEPQSSEGCRIRSSRLLFFVTTFAFSDVLKLLKRALWIWCPLLRELGYAFFWMFFFAFIFFFKSLSKLYRSFVDGWCSDFSAFWAPLQWHTRYDTPQNPRLVHYSGHPTSFKILTNAYIKCSWEPDVVAHRHNLEHTKRERGGHWFPHNSFLLSRLDTQRIKFPHVTVEVRSLSLEPLRFAIAWVKQGRPWSQGRKAYNADQCCRKFWTPLEV